MSMSMRQSCYLFTALALLLVLVSPQVRQLTDSIIDASASDVCVQAASKGCNYANFKKMSKCFNESQGLQVQTRRHLAYCVNCLNKKKSNELGGYYQNEIPVDDCLNEGQMNQKMGIINFTLPQKKQLKLAANFDQKVQGSLPSSLDYSSYNGKNLMTSVKDQGSCGSCWSFAATAAYQAALKNNGFSYDLSIEASLECTSEYAPNVRQNDCAGGYFPDALNFYSKVGGLLSYKYPYLAANYGSTKGYPTTVGICNDTNRIFLGLGTVNLYSGLSNDQIKTLLVNYGPMMVGVYADYGFMSYASGTYSGCSIYAAYFVNHAVLLYGWNSNGDWLIKNQWGTSWGRQGYMTLSKNYDCGLSYFIGYISIPKINTNPQVVMNPESTKTSKSIAPSPETLGQFYQTLSVCLILLLLSYG